VLDRSFLQRHYELADKLEVWARIELSKISQENVDSTCRRLVGKLGTGGWLRWTAPDPQSAPASLDVRALSLMREVLARHDALADFAFAMQGLGVGPISLFGSAEQRCRWLPLTRAGKAIAAFALSEPAWGSDVAHITTAAVRDGDGYWLEGEKTWVSNGGIADVYTVFARTGDPGAKGLTAFVVPAHMHGIEIVERIDLVAPHPIARLRFRKCYMPLSARIGNEGDGFRIATATLDIFRVTVGAAALGFARKALVLALERAARRKLFGAPMAELQLVQGHIADMALDVDAAALLVYRAAWAKDKGATRINREAAMAKLYATEAAQRVIDAAVQIHGGDGVRSGHPVEALYREIRALRIYEGASDIQKVIIARAALAPTRGNADERQGHR
jgi:acyl-CoA dehydrogenase